MNNRTVIVITGPTASGKTSLGVSLALALGTEVVSADSMQLYRGMDIGSAKPTREEMRGVPHHMIDVADPAVDYSVSRWVENAAACCDALLAGGKTPVIVGGTGLYIESLLSGRDFSAAPGDSGVREALGAEYDALGGAVFLLLGIHIPQPVDKAITDISKISTPLALMLLGGSFQFSQIRGNVRQEAARARDGGIYAHRRDDHRARRPHKGAPAAVCFPPLCAHVERAGNALCAHPAARGRDGRRGAF